ncbi:MAG: hypothetical protein ACYDHH_18265 [Solirubrobacteraceae bacterium]
MPRGVSRCPNCREPVSPFAAGCAICGADLEAARAKRAASPRARLEMPSLRLRGPRTGSNIDWVQVVIAYLLALFAGPIGLVLAIYWAYQHSIRAGGRVMMGLMLGAVALSIAALLAPVWFWSHIYGGL